MKTTRAFLVVDLGFGDAGKGTITDHLVRRHGASLVVRANGGAQAGHNVVLEDGRHHTFSQLGAGSFVPGVRTLLASTMVVHPLALEVEARVFAGTCGRDPLADVVVDERAIVTTPFHQAAGRLRELARGDARHGSCGVGVGETVAHAEAHPSEALTVGMLARDRRGTKARLERTRMRLVEELSGVVGELDRVAAADPELRVLNDAGLAERFFDATRSVLARIEIATERRIAEIVDAATAIVCEGAQGVLLDEWHGMHPHTTYSSCTFEPAMTALDRYGFDGPRMRIGVLRTYMVRHGEGPFPSETRELDGLPEPHNHHGPWQGGFRRGFLDLPLLRYAIEGCGGVDALAMTHLDAVDRIAAFRAVVGYAIDDAALRGAFEFAVDGQERFDRLRVRRDRDLRHAELRTRALFAAVPRLEEIPLGVDRRGDYVRFVESALGARICVLSDGPTPSHKHER